MDWSDESVEEAVRAARELSHAACYLSDVATRLARHRHPDDYARLAADAIESSIRAAQSAFSLEKAYRGETDGAAILWLAIDAIAIAEEAIAQARHILETTLAPAIRP